MAKTETRLTTAEQNQLATLVGIAVAFTLLMTAPASRDWIIGHAAGGVTYIYKAWLAPVFSQLGTWLTAAWSWLNGLLSC